jgi:hypothetical protein
MGEQLYFHVYAALAGELSDNILISLSQAGELSDNILTSLSQVFLQNSNALHTLHIKIKITQKYKNRYRAVFLCK